ncbi:hypothetical protein SteCoe_36767 [Stentor coeruleus]|uniref:Uncharacterized protein n=1 Tax=Stentor coeruleus TaxID=5963 RepID=A0A1R2API9_9CILI|nr:hypothetical protein SteCoe_36767 [Stentor coeruleus]
MGCCQNSNAQSLNQNLFKEKFKEAIDSGTKKRLKLFLDILNKKTKKSPILFIDQEIVTLNEKNYNGLGYCVYIGNTKLFKYLFEKGASIQAMEELFEKQNMRAINIICFKGHLNLLKFYLPIYLRQHQSLVIREESFTLDFKDTESKTGVYEYAIHSACRNGMIHIVSYIYNYFQSKPTIPRDFSLNSIEEYTGEDVGLKACRSGSFNMIKFLYEQCEVKFTNLNHNKENAIMICVCGYKLNPSFTYLECISYLVEIVKIDLLYMYEELLLIAENDELVSYLEHQLEKRGVTVKKKDIKDIDKYLLIHHNQDPVEDNSKGFLFSEVFHEQIESNNTFLSSISSSIRSKNICSSIMDMLEPD